MIDAGIFPHDAHVELLGGMLVQMMIKGNPHDYIAGCPRRGTPTAAPEGWLVREEKSLQLGRYSRPEPDIAIVRAPRSQYCRRTPHARETALVVEVAESSYRLRPRREVAAPTPRPASRSTGSSTSTERQIEVYRDPTGRGRSASYRQATTFGTDAEVPSIIDGREFGPDRRPRHPALTGGSRDGHRSTRANRSPRTRIVCVSEYLKMIVAGVFPPDAQVELLDGILVEQMTKYAPHNYTARQLGLLLRGILPAAWFLSEEKSLVLGRYWRPEPDIAVIRGPNSLYRTRDPKAADVGAADRGRRFDLRLDRGEKWRAYAAARIRVYWIVNLPERRIEVYTDPAGRGKSASYRESATFGPDDEVPVVIDGQEVGRLAVRDILP